MAESPPTQSRAPPEAAVVALEDGTEFDETAVRAHRKGDTPALRWMSLSLSPTRSAVSTPGTSCDGPMVWWVARSNARGMA